MHARLNIQKAIQAVGVLLRREGKRAGRLRLLKLLYIADREMLRDHGRLILGSRLVAMKHGPVHSEVLDLINGKHHSEPEWSQYFCNDGRDVRLAKEPGVGELSSYEIDRLNKVVDLRTSLSDWDVADETHGFREWLDIYTDPNENKSIPIAIESVIAAVGREGDKDAILQDLKDFDAFDRFFSDVGGQSREGLKA
jgi:uncharacterized phage-associated protein